MLQRILSAMGWLSLVVLSILWLFSYTHHTTIGIDSETVYADQVRYHYYRLWWPGNGAMLVGHGITWQAYQAQRHYDRFDLAAAFLHPKYREPTPQSNWNRWGFWWIQQKDPQQVWIGIPAYLPVLVLAMLIGGLAARRSLHR